MENYQEPLSTTIAKELRDMYKNLYERSQERCLLFCEIYGISLSFIKVIEITSTEQHIKDYAREKIKQLEEIHDKLYPKKDKDVDTTDNDSNNVAI